MSQLKFLLCAGIAAFLTGCAGNSAPRQKQQAPPPPDVEVVTVTQKSVPIYGDWVATLDGYVNANIQPQVNGYLIEQKYREGSFVHKNDILFEIDARPFEAALEQAQAQLAQARGQLAQAKAQLGLAAINVKRDTPLAAARAIAQSQLDNDIQAQAQYEAVVKAAEATIQSNEAAVKQATLNLGFTKVRSLIDGIAGLATTQIGNLVNQSTTLTTVSQVNPIKVYFPISEQEYMLLASGPGRTVHGDPLRRMGNTPLRMTLSNGEEYPPNGHIVFADRQVNSQTGTIRIVAAFPNPGNVLRPGQFGRIRAITGVRKGALLVPQRAVSELQGRYQVAVVGQDNRVSIHQVQTGDRVGQMWIVSGGGLNAGDRVIADGASKVRDGAVVAPKIEPSETEDRS